MIVPFLAIFILAIGLVFFWGLVKSYIFLYQHSKSTAIFLVIASGVSLLLPDFLMKFLLFLFFSCVAMFIVTTKRKEQAKY